jgi:hypothetical protein
MAKFVKNRGEKKSARKKGKLDNLEIIGASSPNPHTIQSSIWPWSALFEG